MNSRARGADSGTPVPQVDTASREEGVLTFTQRVVRLIISFMNTFSDLCDSSKQINKTLEKELGGARLADIVLWCEGHASFITETSSH